MNIIENTDELLAKQPKLHFEDVLCTPIHKEKIVFTKKRIAKREKSFYSVKIINNFNQDKEYVEIALNDFDNFLTSASINKDDSGTIISINYKQQNFDEDFDLVVNDNGASIFACSFRGVRRALIFIEDEMIRNSSPSLPLGTLSIHPYVKTRISRCFFTPPSHASAEGATNELMSEIDYYPDEYLNRLSHDGINGLWIGSSFRKMLKSTIFPEFGTEEEQQTKKLNNIISKCKKYGIDIYLFVTEPASSCYSKELINHLDLVGCKTGDGFLLPCPSNEKVQYYIKEAVTRLFTLVPDLAGIINISVGESLSGCGSIGKLICPKCLEKYKTLAKTLAETEKLFSLTMQEVAPKTKFISWTYENRSLSGEDVKEQCLTRDKSVYHMQNFEDLGQPKQLGKKRLAYDYWLSYAGPGKLMKAVTKYNKVNNISTFAKIQVCSSHEISTIPYVPVPGILFDKYKFMYKNNIEGVMQCWYFGNYPSMMNKAANMLSLNNFPKTKSNFLSYLAKTYFGQDYLNVAKAWHYFEKGYKNFPVNLAFEWVGPMQDSPCCPLHLKPIDWPMPGTWLKSEHSGGDRIGECLLNGHTIDEAIILVSRINKNIEKGISYFNKLNISNTSPLYEQISNAKAWQLIFKSGENTLRFYKLRHILAVKKCDKLAILKEMKNIVKYEIENSKKLIPISQSDIRIGYHSEANGYKIFPEKLQWRIDKLNDLLKTEFVEVENRIINGQPPLDFYTGNNSSVPYKIQQVGETPKYIEFVKESGEKDSLNKLRVYEDSRFCHIEITTDNIKNDFLIKPEFNIMFPFVPLHFKDGKFIVYPNSSYSIREDNINSIYNKFKFNFSQSNSNYVYTLSFRRKKLNMEINEPFRLSIQKNGETTSRLHNANNYFISQLIRGEFSPEYFGFFHK